MKKVIYLGGFYNIFFALFHSGFWKMFEWDNELNKLSITNSGVMQIFNIQTIYYLIFTAVICFAFPAALQSTKLGKCFLAGTAGFWLTRTVQQFIFFRTDSTAMLVMPAIFLLGVIIFLIPVFRKNSSFEKTTMTH